MRNLLHALAVGVFACGVLAFSAPAQASCEGIQNAFAYNDCLAKEGPQKRSRAPSASAGTDPESTVTTRGRRGRYSRRIHAPEGGRGVTISRRAGGRASATIDPWSSVRASERTMRGARKRRR